MLLEKIIFQKNILFKFFLNFIIHKLFKPNWDNNIGGYLVERYFAQEGAKDETIKSVAELTKQFVNDVLAIQNNNFVAV